VAAWFDRLETRVAIGLGAQVLLTTASASNAYRSPSAVASLHTQITMSEKSDAGIPPDHLIPYNGAAVDQKLIIEAAAISDRAVSRVIALGGRPIEIDYEPLDRSRTVAVRTMGGGADRRPC
jgi:urease accessory protein UreH